MKTFTPVGFAIFLGEMIIEVPHANHEALEGAAVIVETEAKRVIGTYDYNWPELADSTKADRVHQGFPENEPLLRTGEMRDSIEHVSDSREANVGSNNDKAVWQELGTSRGIPPRSFLGQAAVHKASEVVDEIGRVVVGFLETGTVPMGHGLPANPHRSRVL